MADQISSRARNHGVRVKILESVLTLDLPGQKNWKCDLVQLYAPPMGPSVDPEILVKTTVPALRHGEINQRS